MGLKYNGKRNKRDGMMWGNTGTGGCCSASIIQALLRPASEVFTVETLHPYALGFAKGILELSDGSLDYTAPEGHRIETAMRNNRNEDAALISDLTISMDNKEVFKGEMQIAGAFDRQLVTFTHNLIGGIELLYDHLHQMVKLNRQETTMEIGVLAVKGVISHPEALDTVMQATMDKESTPTGFDYENMYGVFPDLDFQYFYGNNVQLKEV